MRALFILLLLVNAVFFYWQTHWVEENPVPAPLAPQQLAPGVKPIVLLKELPAGQNGARAEAPAELTAADTAAAQTCYSLGPFADGAAAEQAAATIKALGVTVERRETGPGAAQGYWVYLKPFKDYAAAGAMAARLQAAGVRDLFIMGAGAHENAISLGLFSQRSAAERRLNEVRAKGFAAVLEPQSAGAARQWLSVSIPAGREDALAPLQGVAAVFGEARLEREECDQL
jgi:hypothetical protein